MFGFVGRPEERDFLSVPLPGPLTRVDVLVLIPESIRKVKGGTPDARAGDAIAAALPAGPREDLEGLRREVQTKSPKRAIDPGPLLPAYRRFDGNMYREIPQDAWEDRAPHVEVVIASALRGLVASRDPIPAYTLSMAEPIPPFGKMNRWWRDRGLPEILRAYLRAVRPKRVVDLLSLEYRESVHGYADGLAGMPVETIDFPGMGRGSQRVRGRKVAEILRAGRG